MKESTTPCECGGQLVRFVEDEIPVWKHRDGRSGCLRASCPCGTGFVVWMTDEEIIELMNQARDLVRRSDLGEAGRAEALELIHFGIQHAISTPKDALFVAEPHVTLI